MPWRATNHPDLLDYALYRRFDDVITFELPDTERIVRTLKAKLAPFSKGSFDWERLADAANGLSYAEITRACEEAAKEMVINDQAEISQEALNRALEERKTVSATWDGSN